MKAAIALTSLLLLSAVACGEPAGGSRPAASPSPREASTHEEQRDAPPPASTEARAPTRSHASESCGELAMTRVALVEEGRGGNHPEVIGVDALLAKCEDKTPSPDA